MKFVLKILFAVGLGATLYSGFNVWLRLNGTTEPQAVTLEELGKSDGTNNVHLTISKFKIGPGVFHEVNKDGRWSRVWLPLLTPSGEWTSRRVVAWSNAVSNDAELKTLLERRVLTGVVSNGMQSLGPNQRDQLAGTYPGVDLNGAIAFKIDGAFPSVLLAYPIAITGVVLLTVVVGLLFGLFQKPHPVATFPSDDRSGKHADSW